MKIIGIILFGIAAASALTVMLEDNLLHINIAPPTPAAAQERAAFTGTITYYPDNLGSPVPYLVYRTERGTVATRALVFGSNSSCATPQGDYPCALIKESLHAYYGGNVRAEGTAENERLIVHTLAAL